MKSNSLIYFAYGSNLHPVRLEERVSSAQLLTTGRLPGFSLVFNKQGQDGSGKCTLFPTDRPEDQVLGAIYTMNRHHKPVLDRFEGVGKGYIDQLIEVETASDVLSCFTYIAQPGHIESSILPFEWYKQLVCEGARYLRFDKDYVNAIQAVEAVADPEPQRHAEHAALLERMRSYRARLPRRTV